MRNKYLQCKVVSLDKLVEQFLISVSKPLIFNDGTQTLSRRVTPSTRLDNNKSCREPLNRYCVAELGTLFAEPARAAILIWLLDGSARPANELGERAGVSQSTASAHLNKLCAGRLLTVLPRGRNRYYRIANEEVAQLVESLSAIFKMRKKGYQPTPAEQDLLRARTCFNHLGGRLGLRIFSRLNDVGGLELISVGVRLTEAGREFLINHKLFRPDQKVEDNVGRLCIEWPDRNFHLSGALGSQLLKRFVDMDWVRPIPDSRALRISLVGLTALRKLGIDRDGVL